MKRVGAGWRELVEVARNWQGNLFRPMYFEKTSICGNRKHIYPTNTTGFQSPTGISLALTHRITLAREFVSHVICCFQEFAGVGVDAFLSLLFFRLRFVFSVARSLACSSRCVAWPPRASPPCNAFLGPGRDEMSLGLVGGVVSWEENRRRVICGAGQRRDVPGGSQRRDAPRLCRRWKAPGRASGSVSHGERRGRGVSGRSGVGLSWKRAGGVWSWGRAWLKRNEKDWSGLGCVRLSWARLGECWKRSEKAEDGWITLDLDETIRKKVVACWNSWNVVD